MLQTVLKALVSLVPLRDGIIGTLSAGELVGLRRRLALHPSKTGFALAHVHSVPTELSTESLWAQTPHHLRGKNNEERGRGTDEILILHIFRKWPKLNNPPKYIISPSLNTFLQLQWGT